MSMASNKHAVAAAAPAVEAAQAPAKPAKPSDRRLRLDDILKEVQRQLNSLSRQAAKARRHQEFSGQLRLF